MHQVNGGVGEFSTGGPQGLTQGVTTGDLGDQGLKRAGAAQPLKITNQGEAAITLTAPAKALLTGGCDRQDHRLTVVGEALELASPLHLEVQILKGLGKKGFVVENGWQDGEMGHGQASTFPDPSEMSRAVQWPLPPVHPPQRRQPLRLGVMASGEGSNFEAVVDACRQGQLPAEVVQLVVNRADCGAVERAKRLGIPTVLLDHTTIPSREDLDGRIVSCFEASGVDLVVMAGWMRIVTQVLIDAYPQRLINIHPSLLPSFRGARAIEQALRAQVRISGCTAHLVELEVDAGPILVQAAVPVFGEDSAETLAERIHQQEHRILPLAVLVAAERLGLLAEQPQG